MYGNKRYVKPRVISIVAALAIAVTVFFVGRLSPMTGYLVAISALLILTIAIFSGSIWPTRDKQENLLIFSLFWGLMLGVVLPQLVRTYLEEGLEGILKILMA